MNNEIDNTATSLAPGGTAQPPLGGGTWRNQSIRDNFPALHYFITVGDLGNASRLLSQGFPVDAVDRENNTALLWAVKNSSNQAIQILVENWNAALNFQNIAGNTPLHIAASDPQKIDIVEYLLARGADPNVANVDGQTPFHVAAASGSKLAAEFLLSAGAFTEVEDAEGDTPLHYAVRESSYEVAQLLLARGANPDHVNEDNESPLQLAAEINDSEMVSIFNSFSNSGNFAPMVMTSFVDNFAPVLNSSNMSGMNLSSMSAMDSSADTLFMSTSPSTTAFLHPSMASSHKASSNMTPSQYYHSGSADVIQH